MEKGLTMRAGQVMHSNCACAMSLILPRPHSAQVYACECHQQGLNRAMVELYKCLSFDYGDHLGLRAENLLFWCADTCAEILEGSPQAH